MPELDRILVYRAKDGWRWRRVAPNEREVAESGEAYENKSDCVEAARRSTTEADVLVPE